MDKDLSNLIERAKKEGGFTLYSAEINMRNKEGYQTLDTIRILGGLDNPALFAVAGRGGWHLVSACSPDHDENETNEAVLLGDCLTETHVKEEPSFMFFKKRREIKQRTPTRKILVSGTDEPASFLSHATRTVNRDESGRFINVSKSLIAGESVVHTLYDYAKAHPYHANALFEEIFPEFEYERERKFDPIFNGRVRFEKVDEKGNFTESLIHQYSIPVPLSCVNIPTKEHKKE